MLFLWQFLCWSICFFFKCGFLWGESLQWDMSWCGPTYRGTNAGSGAQEIYLNITLQRTNTESWKQIFPEKKLHGHSPNFHIHVYGSDVNIITMDLPILLLEICGLILGIYKLLANIWMWKLGLRQRNSQKMNT
jgi:hypothetical protein